MKCDALKTHRYKRGIWYDEKILKAEEGPRAKQKLNPTKGQIVTVENQVSDVDHK